MPSVTSARPSFGGFPAQLVVAAIWLASAALATWASHRAAILTLAIGGALIFPLTQLALRLMGRSASLPKGHPMNALARQIAFIVPLCLPLIAAAALYRRDWFYPAFMMRSGRPLPAVRPSLWHVAI
jgi:hypothetical protein